MSKAKQNADVVHLGQFCGQIGPLVIAAQHSLMPCMITDNRTPGIAVVFANDAFLAMTGFPRSALSADPLKTLFGAAANAETVELLRSAVMGGGAGIWQMQVHRADGGTFIAVVFVSPIRSLDGEATHHVINVFDIAAMLCLSRQMSEIYPAVYDNAPGFIALSRGEHHEFTYANAAYKAFVKRDTLIGRTVAEALPEIVDQGIVALLDDVYHTGRPFVATEMPIRIWDEERGCTERRWIDAVYQPIRNDEGAIIGLFCEGHDVTDLRESNQALAALEMEIIHASRINAMGTMAATLAHELNQPLTAISNYLAGVRPLGAVDPDVGRLTSALEGIKEASEHAAGIIDHVRQLTKHKKPNRAPFILREAVEESVRLVRFSCHSDIVFDNRVPCDLIMTADRVKIQQVLVNLLQNACDAMAETPSAVLTIDAWQDDQNLTVSVADTGHGFSPEALASIFAWTDSAKSEGMGIGLSICRTIIEFHRGTIWLEASGPDGSEFRFSLPPPRRGQPAEKRATSRPGPRQTPRSDH